MSSQEKKIHGILSFIPLAAWSVWCLYILIISKDLIVTQTFQEHDKVVTLLSQHYLTILYIWIAASALTFIILIYNAIHLARIADMHGGTKLGWMVFMICFAPISFPIFWFMQVKKEPENMTLYPNIE
jgi:hypothetical protein